MKNQRNTLMLLFALAAILLVSPQALYSAIVVDPDGTDVDPADPATWTTSTYGYVGNTTAGAVRVDGGSLVESGSTDIGYGSGSTGSVTVDGAGSAWTCDYSLNVGNAGSGTLTITNGGALSVGDYTSIGGWESGSSGTVNVDGGSSTLICDNSLYVGDTGSGTLAITNSAVVSVGGTTYVADYDGSTGSIDFGPNGGTLTTGGLLCSPTQLTGTGTINTGGLVSDVDLVFDATHGLAQTLLFNGPGQNITINLDASGTSGVETELGAGYLGNGSLTIRDGISVTSTYGDIGFHYGSTGTVTVDGAGSTWTCDEGLYVGEGGSGTLAITNGALVSVGFYTDIGGWESGSTGTVTVDGAGSILTCGDGIYVGSAGSGSLTVTNGGAVSAGGYCSIGGWESGSSSMVTVDGSGATWTCGGDLSLSTYDSSSGLVQITNGGLVSVAGTMGIDTYGDGNCFVDIYNGGILALLGDADDSLASFLGLIDGTDAIYYWDNSLSTWADISGATLDDDCTLSYQTTGDLAGYTLLTVQAALDGDANGDGVVDVSDLGVLATNYGTASGAEWSDADFNGDGKVDVSDLGVLATMYGSSTEAAPSQAVPEPSTFVLLVMGVVGLLGYARCRRR